jgi:hypothetical protein
MIKRKLPKTVKLAENLKEYSFTATRAIDITTAPTIRDTVYDITNLDVNLDGSLSVRKPLIFKRNLTESAVLNHIKTEYLFDNENIVKVYRDTTSGNIKILGLEIIFMMLMIKF